LNNSPVENGNTTAVLQKSLRNIDEMPVFTIHGFCSRMLREHAFETLMPMSVEIRADIRFIVEETAADFIRNFSEKRDRTEIHAANLSVEEATDFLMKKSNFFNEKAMFKSFDMSKFENSWETIRQKIKSLSTDTLSSEDEKKALSVKELAGQGIFRKLKFKSFPSVGNWRGMKKEVDDLIAEADKYSDFVKSELFSFAAREIPLRMERKEMLSYNDMITRLHRALEKEDRRGCFTAKSIAGEYEAVLIDEFQDTDSAQYAIFSKLFGVGSHYMFFIGDPKQSIYRFRGADIFAYFKAAENADKKYTLNVNYRSDHELVSAVNKFFSIENPFASSLLEFREVSSSRKPAGNNPALFIWKEKHLLPKTRLAPEIADNFAGKILDYIKGLHDWPGEGTPRFNDMAVLVGNRYEAEQIEEKFAGYGIPTVSHSSNTVFTSEEAFHLFRVSRAVLKNEDERLIRNSLMTKYFRFDFSKLWNISKETSRWEKVLLQFREFRKTWEKGGFLSFVQKILQHKNVKRGLLSTASGKRSIVNTLHLGEIMAEYEYLENPSMEELLDWFAQRLKSETSAEEYERRLDNDENAVSIYTTHKSKGLEFPIVFIPYPWSRSEVKNNSFFSVHKDGRRVFTNLPEYREKAEEETEAENRRLLYVALTRAKHHCHIYLGKVKDGRKNRARSDILSYYFSKYIDKYSDHDSIAVVEKPETGKNERVDGTSKASSENFTVRKLSRDMGEFFWSINSFSSLVKTMDSYFVEEYDFNTDEEDMGYKEIPKKEDIGIFDFPAGAHAGNAVHEIFETIDFTDDNNDGIIESILKKHALFHREECEESWLPVIREMVNRTLEVKLNSEGLSLNKISLKNRMSEMEFHFIMKRLKAEDMESLYPGLKERPVEGLMHGFIDLVFRAENRYYIVDWKSNLLEKEEAYKPGALEQEMKKHNYDLQLIIYSVALHLHLSKRIPDYSFDTHFGGVYYLFVRGAGCSGEGSGIYFKKPEREKIEFLTSLMTGEENHD
ncbi:MAG: UvrD-helicase domain-containing protein, partial [bacterium]